jgi:hypothetical protein
MDLGTYAPYPMPANIRQAFGADTAQQLADQLGITATAGPELAREADTVWGEYKRGNLEAVTTFMTERLGMTQERAEDTLAKLRKAQS